MITKEELKIEIKNLELYNEINKERLQNYRKSYYKKKKSKTEEES